MPPTTFWHKVADVTSHAARTPIGNLLMPLGFHITHTGGNNWAWELRLPNGWFCYVTDDDGDLGEREDQQYFVGVYRDADAEPVSKECANAREMLDFVWSAVKAAVKYNPNLKSER